MASKQKRPKKNTGAQPTTAKENSVIEQSPEERSSGEKSTMELLRNFLVHPIMVIVFLTFAVFVFYGNTLNAEFVYDDLGQIQENPRIRDLGNIPSLFTKSVWSFLEPDDEGKGLNNYYRPVQFVVYSLTFYFAQLDPGAYHWVSVILHLLNVYLVFLLGYRLLESRIWGMLAGLIFAMHPIQTEVVSWVACQPEQLYTMCYVGSILLYLKFHEHGTPWYRSLRFYLVVFLYYIGLFCKEAMITLPVFLFLMDLIKYPGQKIQSLALRLIPFVAAFILYLPWRFMALGGFAPVQRYTMLPWFQVFLTIPDLLRQYLQKMVYPVPLSAYYRFMPVLAPEDLRFWLAMFLLFIIAGAAYVLWHKKLVTPLLGIVWFFLTLAPMLYIRGIGENVFCERYMYLPSTGFILVVVYVLQKFISRFNTIPMQVTLLVVLGIMFAGMGKAVTGRNHDWHDKGAFMRSLGKSKLTTPGFLCHDEAVYLVEQAKNVQDPQQRVEIYHEALRQFEECEKNYDTSPNLYFNRGVVYLELGQLDEAENELKKGFMNKKSDAGVYVMLGQLELKRENPDAAKQYFLNALEIDPHFPHAFAALARFATMKGDFDEALEYYRKLDDEIPNQAGTKAEICSTCLMKNDLDTAEKYCKEAVELDPRLIPAYGNLGTIYNRRGEFEKSKQMYEKVLSIDPNNMQAKMLISKINSMKNSPGSIPIPPPPLKNGDRQ